MAPSLSPIASQAPHLRVDVQKEETTIRSEDAGTARTNVYVGEPPVPQDPTGDRARSGHSSDAIVEITISDGGDKRGSDVSAAAHQNLSREALPDSLVNRKPVIEQFDVDDQVTRANANSVEKKRFRRRRYAHFVAICWLFFLGGWNAGTNGPLLPRIQSNYHIGFVTVSLIFIFTCIGSLAGATTNMYLGDKLGFGKAVTLGSVLQFVAYAVQSIGGPYPLMLCAYTLCGFSVSIALSQGSAFITSFKGDTHVYLGLVQASYGLGAFAAPLIATQFAASKHWSFHFLVSAGLSAVNVVTLYSVFKLRTEDEIMAEAGQEPADMGGATAGIGSKYRQILLSRPLHLFALWSLFYVGMEFTLGGWIVTFVIDKRHGGANSGYISSGFFGGMTVGRVTLLWINRAIGEHRVLYVYTILAIILEITIWTVPSLIENAIAVSVIGLVLGPMYPIMLGQASRILPKRILAGSLGWIGGIGTTGSAMLPFITGVLAAQHGIGALQPLLIAIMTALMGIWALVPTAPVRVD